VSNAIAPLEARVGCAALAAHPPRQNALGLSITHIRTQKSDLWQVNAYSGGSLIEVKAPGLRGQKGGGKRGVIKRFSEGSRRRLLRALSRTQRDKLPVFVTLTYPDGFPGDPRRWKDDLKAWVKRVIRQFPDCAGFWKLELKVRQSGVNQGAVAPHFHLLLWGLPESWEQPDGNVWTLRFIYQRHQIAAPSLVFWKKEKWCDGHLDYSTESSNGVECQGRVLEFSSERVDKNGKNIRSIEFWKQDDTGLFEKLLGDVIDEGRVRGKVELTHWVSLTWAAVVKSGDPRHVRAGTRVEQIRSSEGVMFYASKYVGKLDAETVGNAGRFWGLHNLKAIPWAEVVKMPVDQKQAFRVVRVGRRYIWAGQRQRKHPRKARWRSNCGMTIFCDAFWWLERLHSLAGG
jgi:hypothetical protein